MALNAGDNATIRSLNVLAVRFAMLAARREIEEATADRAATYHGRPEVDRLIRLAEQTAKNHPDLVEELAGYIRIVAASDADQYLLMGVLIEGAVHSLTSRIPTECQTDTASALLKLLTDRLRACGLLDA